VPSKPDSNADKDSISDDDLTGLALQYPPPDDAPIPGEPKPTGDRPRGPSPSPRFWRVTLFALGAIAAIAIFVPNTAARVASRVLSPDGSTEAVLIATETGGIQGHKVCFRRPTGAPLNVKRCTEVAYLSGLSEHGDSHDIELVWTSPGQLEIRYPAAAFIHVYKPVFVWGAMGYPNASGGYNNRLPSILVRAVPTQTADPITH
jgi:hypothetical protein